MTDIKKNVITQLEERKITPIDVPADLRDHMDIIKAERRLGLCLLDKRGYDVILGKFFVEEKLICGYAEEPTIRTKQTLFEDFRSFYEYVDGQIYEKACYYQCPRDKFGDSMLDYQRLYEIRALSFTTIDDVIQEMDKEYSITVENAKRNNDLCKKWFIRFNSCNSFEDLCEVTKSYNRSKVRRIIDLSVFFYNYLFSRPGDRRCFDIAMQYLSVDSDLAARVAKPLCYVYHPDQIVGACDFREKSGASKYRRRSALKSYAQDVKNGKVIAHAYGYYDPNTQYYFEKTILRRPQAFFETYEIVRCFENLDSFVKYRKRNLKNVDLSEDVHYDYDFSSCITDETTKLPQKKLDNVQDRVSKRFWKGQFEVEITCSKRTGENKRIRFKYFFELLAFLKNDLSGADFTMCDGLINLEDIAGINFENAKLSSAFCRKFKLPYEKYVPKKTVVFDIPSKNEKETQELLVAERESSALPVSADELRTSEQSTVRRVYYVSDLHLDYKMQKAGVDSLVDAERLVNQAVERIKGCGWDSLILIDGDVSADFDVFMMFITTLKKRKSPFQKIVFTLGNHELWAFPGESYSGIMQRYLEVISDAGMFLLQNDILFEDVNGNINRISSEEICSSSPNKIREKTRCAFTTLFGGLGFAGYNIEFNADNGIYRGIITRKEEIEQTQAFESLYQKVELALSDKPVIIMTHMPKDDWCSEGFQKNFIYVSGHTHRNVFYDDGEIRFYADNQAGYKGEFPYMKWFYVNKEYDYFEEYEDGIYEIDAEQYREFYRGKNVQLTFNRPVYKLYMLKKLGYYCFLHKSRTGTLTILNGGALRKLPVNDVRYYYDHMDEVVSRIKQPLIIYNSLQKQISAYIRKFGGYGSIHGCIIDIDFYNHVYLNPFDQTITAYWASDIVYKHVYPSLPALLEKECPLLYTNYQRMLCDESQDFILPVKYSIEIEKPKVYLGTEIYRASREIRRMQKLAAGILAGWYEPSENSAIYALPRLQEQMKGEANKAGFLSEEDVAEWITRSRREEASE